MHVLIDGYNLLRQIRQFQNWEQTSLEFAREQLIAELARYKRRNAHAITVVFDGVQTLSEFPSAYKEAGISVMFAPSSVTADDVIVDFVAKSAQTVTVITSDHGLEKRLKPLKTTVLSSVAFYQRLRASADSKDRDETPSPVHKRWLTKKKGPAKRLPKNLRKKNQIKDKL